MIQRRTNVVPFERPAAYWALRARKHYTTAQLPNAARMMRKALEKSGDTGLALELAQIYAGMGCYTAAERCLIRASVRHGLTGSLCYAIAMCAFNRGNEDLAEEALDLCLRLEPDGFYADQAQDLLEAYPWHPGWALPRSARSDELCRQSIRALTVGNLEKALKLARGAWERGHSPRAALWLGMLLPADEGMRYLDLAAEELPLEIKPQLKYAQASFQLGRLPQARERLIYARRLCKTITDAETYCAAAFDMNRPGDALKLVAKKLEETPASVDYLRLKYLCLRRMGEEEQAGRALEALLEIDPDDADALFDRRHPAQASLHADRGMLLAALGSLVYAHGERCKPGPLNRVLHLMVMSLNGTVEAENIYRLLPPLWKRLTKAEKAACDERRDGCFHILFSVYLLISAGNWHDAQTLLAAAKHKKRVVRLLRRLIRRNGPNALHQL